MYSSEIDSILNKLGAGPGDTVKINYQNGEIEGILMPRPEVGDNSIVVIKRKDGYNMGIKYAKSVKIEKLNVPRKSFSFASASIKKEKSLPSVAIVATGGTIESKVDYLTGGVHMLVKPEELIHDVPELGNIANINVDDIFRIPSEDMTYKEWAAIAESVAKHLNSEAKGAIVMMGTDTLHYASAALSFMLGETNAPVVVTAAQRSPDRGSSDAFMNLICSAYAATKSDIAEVGVCMHSSSSDKTCDFIRGNKVRKMHTSRRDAFKAINSKPIARINPEGKIEYISQYKKVDPNQKGKIKPLTKFDPSVALIKAYPNSDPEIIDHYISKKYKGIIIEGTGFGHVPVSPSIKENSWISHIKNATESGVIVGMTSQCLFGRVNSEVYRNLRLASGAGAVYCEDMLPEVAYVKLGFLLGNHGAEKARSMLNKDIAGEITQRTELDTYLE